MKHFNLILLASGVGTFLVVKANELGPNFRVLVPGGHTLTWGYFKTLIKDEERGWAEAWYRDVAVPQWREYRNPVQVLAALLHMLTDV